MKSASRDKALEKDSQKSMSHGKSGSKDALPHGDHRVDRYTDCIWKKHIQALYFNSTIPFLKKTYNSFYQKILVQELYLATNRNRCLNKLNVNSFSYKCEFP